MEEVTSEARANPIATHSEPNWLSNNAPNIIGQPEAFEGQGVHVRNVKRRSVHRSDYSDCLVLQQTALTHTAKG